MLCNTWNDLYEQYERASLKRVERSKRHSFATGQRELESLSTAIAVALRALREHEKQHHCHS